MVSVTWARKEPGADITTVNPREHIGIMVDRVDGVGIPFQMYNNLVGFKLTAMSCDTWFFAHELQCVFVV